MCGLSRIMANSFGRRPCGLHIRGSNWQIISAIECSAADFAVPSSAGVAFQG
jgi:hypothetical protein